MAEEEFHIAMFPWFAMGHTIPYIHLANELAARDLRISILLPNNTSLNLQHQNLHPNLISFRSLPVPDVEGLPPGTETVSDIPFSDHHLVAISMDLMRQQVEQILTAIKPNLVLFDFAYWIPDIAKQLGSKSVMYNVVSATAIAFVLASARKVPKDRVMKEEELKEIPSGYPSSTVVLRGYEFASLNGILMPFGYGNISFYDRKTTAMRNCDALAIRTCRELEGKYCDYIRTQYGKSVLLTGTALPKPDNSTRLEDRWDKWLSRFERDSVVFCVFGSQCTLENDQFRELILGFELTGLPFLAALKPPVGCTTVEEALPEGFEERLEGRGVVFGGWVQQTQILSHASVGCFVNHCGFGSMWEGLMSDNQIVLVPNLGDQIMNSRLLVEELKVAVEVEKDEKGWFSKENLSRAIRCVMDKDGEVGIMVKKNHAKLKEVLEKPGLMDRYIDEFVQNLQELVKLS
ncbi:UDP-glycosyltransferase 79B9 [Ziziphus jujuba]|uniref:UDP-glycosyltransferase 79B9 n=1 Tax=Ziziphus jujuba TaxID=326968 RepID=A0A6P4AU14_ZIZJJ|nr:UDP-glycosyltransferase 79B9 [Ziziphus jujuba]